MNKSIYIRLSRGLEADIDILKEIVHVFWNLKKRREKIRRFLTECMEDVKTFENTLIPAEKISEVVYIGRMLSTIACF